MSPSKVAKLALGAVLIFAIIAAFASSSYVVQPGFRGVLITLGKVSPVFRPEGFGFKAPFVTRVEPILIRQQTQRLVADCYSSDLQQIKIDLGVLFRIPEASVVTIYRDYEGDAFETLLKPRIAEAIKEVTALRTAENIVQKRGEVKSLALDIARKKIGAIVGLEDLVLTDMNLSKVLEHAIEAKMVQQQEAARARFTKQQADVEANTVLIKAKGEAESINLRGRAIRENPSILQLEIVERWDGITPLVVGTNATGIDMLLPVGAGTGAMRTEAAR
jgi:prohibitin 2